MRYLITGGTGSFGRAMTRFLLDEDKGNHVVIYSRGEHAQYQMSCDYSDAGGRVHYFIGDVRDRDRLCRAFHSVDVVMHAAALKRIEVGRYNPIEMVKTNVLGAINVIEACKTAGVPKCIFLSTDKAYQPISPYGQTKALAESLFLNAYQQGTGPKFAVTRYGNVWRSQGSVVPKWESLRDQGCLGFPVTDSDATRFYMTMKDAIDLVYMVSRHMLGGELVIPDWLRAYRLGDLVRAMGGYEEVIGLPPWEKKHEGMKDGCTSDKAERMSVTDLREALL